MSVIAEFSVRHPGLALATALDVVEGVELDLIQQVGTDPERPYLFVWAGGDDLDAFEAAVDADPTVDSGECYTELDDRRLYRMQITDDAEVVSYPMWVELGADQLEARWRDGWWHNRMRFPDRDALVTYREWSGDHGFDFDLHRIYGDDDSRPTDTLLTADQREALQVAQDMGYFEIPRAVSMADVADAIGISSQAVSERLRRAHQVLVEEFVR